MPPLSDHFDGRRFFNPGVDHERSFGDFLRWRRMRKPALWPAHVENPVFAPPPDSVGASEIAVTAIGHATLLVQVAGFHLLTDPVFAERTGPFALGPRRVRAPGVALDRLPRIDAVLLSHNHYDHMDLTSLRRLRDRWDPVIITGLENGRYLAKKRLHNSIELDWWQSCEPRPGIKIRYVPAQHWSSRRVVDRRRMLWGGHVVEAAAGKVYFAGDTGYPAEFREITRRLGPPDIALLPIGSYEPRWFMAGQHMNPDDAVRAHRDLGAGLSLAIHFATFHLTDEAIDAPVEALAAALVEHNVTPDRFRVPGFGETLLWTRQSASLAPA